MKRILILLFLFIPNVIFSQVFPAKLLKQIENTGLFDIIYENQKINDNQNSGRFKLEIFSETNDIFSKKTINSLNEELFPEREKVTFDDIKLEFEKCTDIFMTYGHSYSKFDWIKGKKFDFSVMYSQTLWMRIQGFGVYVFRIFAKDSVYTLRLSCPMELEDRNADFDSLSDYFYFKEGTKMNLQKGIEGTQGYYSIDRNAAEYFYNKLAAENKTLPESALKFQDAKKTLEKILARF